MCQSQERWEAFAIKKAANEAKAQMKEDELLRISLLDSAVRAPGTFSSQVIGSEENASTTRGKHLSFSLAASVDWASQRMSNEVRLVDVMAV